MRTEKREVYFCEYCNKLYQKKHACIIHEKYCSSNPDTKRICFSCEHFDKELLRHYFDTYCGESYEDVTVFYCKKKEIALYPPKVEGKKNWFEFGDVLNEPMKKECNEYLIRTFENKHL